MSAVIESGNFETENVLAGKFSYLHYVPWTTLGLMHGYTDNFINFHSNAFSKNKDLFCTSLGLSALFVPKQVHGNQICDLSFSDLEAITESQCDGLIIPNFDQLSSKLNKRLAIGIRTADCLPLIMRCGAGLALVHAGWRGLASGIVEKTALRLRELNPNAVIEICLGPSAGASNYEVGQDVYEALATPESFRVSQTGKYLLNLSSCVEIKLAQHGISPVVLHRASVCTISNANFPSHRRDGDKAGRMLCFVVCRGNQSEA